MKKMLKIVKHMMCFDVPAGLGDTWRRFVTLVDVFLNRWLYNFFPWNLFQESIGFVFELRIDSLYLTFRGVSSQIGVA